MSLYDDASLALLTGAGAGKDGKLYVAKPTDGTGDFTFSRGSNLAATRVGADGLIEKGRENLLTKSNNFTAWNLQNVTSGHAGYDGTNDAWLQSGTSRLQRNISLGTSVYTGSIYVKAGFSEYVQLYIVGSSTALARFQLTGNGTIVFSGGISPKIEPVSGATGWYRISTNLNSDITTFRIYPQNDSSGTQTADSSVYIQDAQLEIGLAATDYIESGATTGKAGLLEDEPRFDYSDGAACPSLLIESSRTQIIPYSEALLSYNQFKVIGSETTIDYTSGTTPEGITSSIATISETATTGNHRAFFEDIDPCTIGSTYSFSVFAKSIGGRNIRIGDGGKGFEADTIVDLSDGTVLTDVNNNVTVNAYGNGWYRISMSGTNNSIYATQRFFINSVDGTTLSFAGDVSKGVLLWGAQFEESDSPTSYIPNHSGASITRNRDYANGVANTAQIGDDIGKGTWLIDIKRAPGEANQSLFLAPKANLTQQIRLHFDLNGVMRFRDARNGYATIGAGRNTTDRTKLLVKVDTDGGIAKVFINGEQVGDTYVLGATPFEFGRIIIENRHYNLYSTVFFPEALTDVECIKLTEL